MAINPTTFGAEGRPYRARGLPPHERRTLTYKSVGSSVIRADLYRPTSDARVPLIFWIRGGGLIGSHARTCFLSRNAYLGLGVAVLAIDYRHQRGRWPREVSGLDPAEDRDALEAYCPVRHASSAFPPTLFLHGDADRDVPREASLSTMEALRAVGVDADLVTVRQVRTHVRAGRDGQAIEAFGRVIQFLQASLELT